MILFVDDEPLRIRPWVKACEDAFNRHVELSTRVEDALDLFEAGAAIDLLVWDLMMPRGPFGDPDTEYGTRTGLLLLARFRESYLDNPAILLTNVRDDALFSRLGELEHVHVGRKRDLGPTELVEIARRLLAEG